MLVSTVNDMCLIIYTELNEVITVNNGLQLIQIASVCEGFCCIGNIHWRDTNLCFMVRCIQYQMLPNIYD